MFATQKSIQGGQNSERENENQDISLKFLVQGSTVPIHNQKSGNLRKWKNFQDVAKEQKRKAFTFPLDKVIFLSERLELKSATENKIKAISLSKVDTDSSDSRVESRSQKDEKRVGSRASSPCFDFALDLSCISNTGDESDENSYPTERNTLPNNNRVTTNPPGSEIEVGETSQGPEGSDPHHFHFSAPEECENQMGRGSDSISVYVETVNKKKDLMRFFRPCRICNELCCVCSRSPSYRELRSSTPQERFFNNTPCRNCGFFGIQGSFEGTESDGIEFEFEDGNCPLTEKKKRVRPLECYCSEIFATDFLEPACGEECKCRSDFTDSARTLSYTSSLASAARSARILARDLEFILNTMSIETERSKRRNLQ